MGRVTMLTPELMESILDLIRLGIHPPIAAQSKGVAESTWYQWIARGEGTHTQRLSEPIFIELVERVAEADAQAESTAVITLVQKLRTAKEVQEFMAARWPDRWGKRTEITLNVRREAERIAAETGLNVDDLVAEIESFLATAQ